MPVVRKIPPPRTHSPDPDLLKNAINVALDRERSAHGLTEAELARHLRTNSVTLWRWRKGEVAPSMAILLPLVIESLSCSCDKPS